MAQRVLNRFGAHPFFWLLATVAIVLGADLLAGQLIGPAVIRWFWALTPIPALVLFIVQERRVGARPSPWSVLTVTAAAAFSAWIWGFFGGAWWQKVLLLLAAGVSMSIANGAYRGDRRRAQGRRERAAATVVDRVLRGDADVSAFAFYLRPFVSTDRLPSQPLPATMTPGELPIHLDLESMLARVLRDQCPLIALGRPGEMLEGAARVETTEDDWQRTVRAVAERAAFVVVVPLAYSGTMWELQLLRSHGLLDRTLLVMPELPREAASGVWTTTEDDSRVFDAGFRSYSGEAHILDVPAEWMRAAETASAFGVELPPLASAGALFTIDPGTLGVGRIAPLALSALARRGRYLRAVLAEFGLLAGDSSNGDLIQEYQAAVLYQGETTRYALVLAADAYVVWGDLPTATALLRRVVASGRHGPDDARDYLTVLPQAARWRSEIGDRRATSRYLAAARHLLSDPSLPAVDEEVHLQLEQLGGG